MYKSILFYCMQQKLDPACFRFVLRLLCKRNFILSISQDSQTEVLENLFSLDGQ